jgi:DNA-binding NtrC family response regulator
VSNDPSQAPTSPDPAPIGILIVDDEPQVRELLGRTCSSNGFHPILAASGEEALTLFSAERDRIDVVLLDVRLPGISGPATLDALRAIDPEVRCCFMSGGLGDVTPEELLQRGARHLFEKPFNLQELIDILRQIAEA